MALSLFTRRRDVQDPATWTPPGTVVSQRYRALKGAIALVYTDDTGQGTCFAVQPSDRP